VSDVYALKQPHPNGSEWIQEFDTLEEAVRYRSHSGGVLVRRERIEGQTGSWWVDVPLCTDNPRSCTASVDGYCIGGWGNPPRCHG